MHIRTLQNLPRPLNVLTTHSAWLFSSLVLLGTGGGASTPNSEA